MLLKVLLLLVIAFVGTLPSLAHASPTDPTWVSGLWDDADHDDVILLIWGFAGTPAPSDLSLPSLAIPLAEFVPPLVTDPHLVDRLPAFLRRAPPPA